MNVCMKSCLDIDGLFNHLGKKKERIALHRFRIGFHGFALLCIGLHWFALDRIGFALDSTGSALR